MKDNLKWDKNAKFCCDSTDWFNSASVWHMISCFLFQHLVMGIYPGKLNQTGIIICLVITNVLHAFEDFLENKTIFSVEGLVSRLFNCRNPDFLDHMDHDTLQNFLGDIMSGFIGTILAVSIMKPMKVKTVLLLFMIILIYYYLNCHKIFSL